MVNLSPPYHDFRPMIYIFLAEFIDLLIIDSSVDEAVQTFGRELWVVKPQNGGGPVSFVGSAEVVC